MQTTSSSNDITTAGVMRLVNSDWCRFISSYTFTTIYINSRERYTSIASINPESYFLSHIHPMHFAKILAISCAPSGSNLRSWSRCPHFLDRNSSAGHLPASNPTRSTTGSMHIQQVKLRMNEISTHIRHSDPVLESIPTPRPEPPVAAALLIATWLQVGLKPQEIIVELAPPGPLIGAVSW